MDESWDRHRQYIVYVALSLAAAGMTAILMPSSSAYFQRFFGNANPILVVLVASVVGGIALHSLQVRSGFEIMSGRATLRGVAISAGLATLLAVAIIVADFFIRYPADINVPPPQALFFYPAVGFVAEIVFHVLPLALMLLVLAPLEKRFGAERVGWLAILLVAALEPTFQLAFEENRQTWGATYTWGHIFVIALLQLSVFRRYDFVSMYSFRIFYYAYWHVAWGVMRLEILF